MIDKRKCDSFGDFVGALRNHFKKNAIYSSFWITPAHSHQVIGRENWIQIIQANKSFIVHFKSNNNNNNKNQNSNNIGQQIAASNNNPLNILDNLEQVSDTIKTTVVRNSGMNATTLLHD